MNRRVVAAALAIPFALAVSASAASAAAIIFQGHGGFYRVNPTDNLCGIDGSSVYTGIDQVQVLGDGTFKDESVVIYTFTSAATGTSVQISNHEAVQGGVPVDNGDGTATVVNTFNGMPAEIKLQNGPLLIVDAGQQTMTITFDTATGQVISFTTSQDGPHPIFASSSAVCDAVVPALS
jgi:hypothetical protein